MKRKLIYTCLSLFAFCASLSARDIFVDCNYTQEADGSLEKPFSKIAKALDFAKEGDSIVLKAGIYRESINITKDNLEIKNYKDDYVLISPMKEVSLKDCEEANVNGHKVYKIPTNEKVVDVFVGGELFHLARYPNKTESMQSNKDWLWTMLKEEDKDIVRFTEVIEGEPIKKFTDGYYLGLHDRHYLKRQTFAAWYSLILPIVSTDENGIISLNASEASSGYVVPQNPNKPTSINFAEGVGLGYVIGAKEAFDAPCEWYIDSNNNTYFIINDAQEDENLKVEYRVALTAVEVNAKNVSLVGLNFKATSLAVFGDNFAMDFCSMRYMAPFIHAKHPKEIPSNQSLLCQWGDISNGSIGLYVKANGAKITNSYFAHSYFSGIRIKGDNALVENCIVEDINWLAVRCAGIHPWGDNILLRKNTVRNVGGSGLEGGNASKNWCDIYATNNIWEHNLIENTTNLIVDQGAFYTNQQVGTNPYGNNIVRYNIMKDVLEPDKGTWTNGVAGLYIDNNSSGFLVHNNVVINARRGIKYNDFPHSVDSAGRDVYYFNNTFVNVDMLVNYGLRLPANISKNMLAKGKEPIAKNLIIQNNLALSSTGDFTSVRLDNAPLWTHNYCEEELLVKDVKNLDFSIQGNALKLAPSKLNYAYILKFYPDIANTDYVGAVDPKKGMFEAGSTLPKKDYKAQDLKLLRAK